MDKEKFIEELYAVEVPDDYDLRWKEALAIHKAAQIDWGDNLILAFRYGFLQGARAAREGGVQE